MPFSCARAVCATFCHHIAGALIPIFGPTFPSECVPADSPDHGRMIIDPAIVAEAARKAASFRRMYMESHEQHQQQRPPRHRTGGSSPRHHETYDYRALRPPPPPPDGSPYGTDTEGEGQEAGRYMVAIAPLRSSNSSGGGGGWTTANHHHHHHHRQPYRDEAFGANPLLSAIPRWAAVSPHPHHQLSPAAAHAHSYPQSYYHHQHQQQQDAYPPPLPLPQHHRLPPVQPPWATTKRSAPLDVDAADYEYDGGESSQSGSGSSPAATSRGESAPGYDELSPSQAAPSAAGQSQSAAEKNAALLLIGLSVRDRRDGSCSPAAGELPAPVVGTHRSKRQRASSY